MNNDLDILRHSLGLNQNGNGRSYRNYFVTGPGSDDYAICMSLVERGLMTRSKGNAITGGDDVFRVTEAGRAYVAAQGKVHEGPRNTYGCACQRMDAHACILQRYGCDCGDPSERCECLCHQWSEDDDH